MIEVKGLVEENLADAERVVRTRFGEEIEWMSGERIHDGRTQIYTLYTIYTEDQDGVCFVRVERGERVETWPWRTERTQREKTVMSEGNSLCDLCALHG